MTESFHAEAIGKLAKYRYDEAVANGALAAVWRYEDNLHADGQPHQHLDGRIYIIRDSWAFTKNLVQCDPDDSIDESRLPGQGGCACRFQYLYAFREIPDHMLTPLGRESLSKPSGSVRETGSPTGEPSMPTKNGWLSRFLAPTRGR